jgi:hypothetical protein
LHEASGSAAGVTGFVDALLKLLRDSEAEVRAAAASVISGYYFFIVLFLLLLTLLKFCNNTFINI